MIAPVRNIRSTRYGEYLQVGDKSVFVPGEGSFDKSGLIHLNKEICFAVFTDGCTKHDRPDAVADVDQETKHTLKKYYEDMLEQHPLSVPVKLHY